jgi:hypothetical protein
MSSSEPRLESSSGSTSESGSESKAVRTFLKRLFLFSLPMLAYIAVVGFCDPFDFLGWASFVPDQIKLPISRTLNPCLLALSQFHRNPAQNILLGDSRMLEVEPERVTALRGERYVNLAYGGASLRECLETFWSATRETKLKHVYFAIDLEMYNDYSLTDRTETYRSISGSPGLYFVNRTVLQAAAYSIYGTLTHEDMRLDAVNIDRAAFWKLTIDGPQTARLFENYVYPVKYHADLEEMGRYAKQNGIDLTFILFPTHMDFQMRSDDFGLEPQRRKMREDLAAIAPVIDFDYENELTRDQANFRDPLHLARPAMNLVTDEIWGARVQYARRYPPLPIGFGSRL